MFSIPRPYQLRPELPFGHVRPAGTLDDEWPELTAALLSKWHIGENLTRDLQGTRPGQAGQVKDKGGRLHLFILPGYLPTP